MNKNKKSKLLEMRKHVREKDNAFLKHDAKNKKYDNMIIGSVFYVINFIILSVLFIAIYNIYGTDFVATVNKIISASAWIGGVLVALWLSFFSYRYIKYFMNGGYSEK